MKTHFALILILFVAFPAFAQHSIEASFNDVYVGNNVSLVYKRQFNRHELYAGLKYQIRILEYDQETTIYKGNFYARSFDQFWGPQIGYRYNFPLMETSSIYLFYDAQFIRSDVRVVLGRETDPKTGRPIPAIFPDQIGLEQHIGLGLKTQIYGDFFLHLRGGGGMTMIGPGMYVPKHYHWNLSGLMSVGLEYRLAK